MLVAELGIPMRKGAEDLLEGAAGAVEGWEGLMKEGGMRMMIREERMGPVVVGVGVEGSRIWQRAVRGLVGMALMVGRGPEGRGLTGGEWACQADPDLVGKNMKH